MVSVKYNASGVIAGVRKPKISPNSQLKTDPDEG